MKLSDTKPYFESSGDMEEHFFSIKDQGMIFEILRSKMYSNPILAICREITCNARDAHREVKTPQVPVHIHLPIGLEPYWRVKDFGPGISPDRMLNIFIQYTASTKRDDNEQTGGFGLGAKTPFSYSDAFEVTTVHDGIRYSYTCNIDSTKVGKLLLLDKRPTDEPNGTEIAIQVKPNDFNTFHQYTEQACRHWEVKPTITGGHIDWQVINKIAEGTGWAITNSTDYNRHARCVIDGIEYPLTLDDLRKYADTKLIDAARGNFIMYFGVGELSLSANREQLFLDKPTQTKIRERIDVITSEVRKNISDKIDAFPNLWDANVYYRKELNSVFHNLHFLGKLFWKTHELTNGYLEVKCGMFTFSRGKHSRKYGTDPNKLTRSGAAIGPRSFHFEEGVQLYINDLPIKEPTPRHVKKAFDDDPKLQTILVIVPNDKATEADLNKAIHLDEMKPKRLSTITKANARAYTPPAQRLLIFKFDAQASAFRQVSYDNMEEDGNDKVLCLLGRDNYTNRAALLASGKVLGSGALKALLEKNTKISFYGVDKDTDPKRLEEEFNDFDKLGDFIDKKVLNNKSINYVEIKFAEKHTYDIDGRMLKYFDKLEPLVTDKQSLFIERLQLHKAVEKLSGHDRSLLDIYESVKGPITDADIKKFVTDHPNWDIQSVNRAYEKKYPLLGAINTYNLQHVIEHVAHYVNMADKI
jgi:Histidine kinase-, DNA gyrase B-, and HSP90-like ATPase